MLGKRNGVRSVIAASTVLALTLVSAAPALAGSAGPGYKNCSSYRVAMKTYFTGSNNQHTYYGGNGSDSNAFWATGGWHSSLSNSNYTTWYAYNTGSLSNHTVSCSSAS